MPAYLISEVSEVVDAAKMEEYRTLAQAAIQRYGGHYLVRGGVWESIEGDWALERVVVVEFPSVDQARAWYRSPEYGQALELSRVALKRRMLLVEGVEGVQAKPTHSPNYLKALATAHFVLAGLGYVFSFLPLIHIAFGVYFLFNVSVSGNAAPPPFMAWMFIVFGAFAIVAGLALSTCILICGLLLHRRKQYWICFALACVECVLTPFGTILGVLTIVTISSESTKAEFLGRQRSN
jgi:uncharacterized protein (DUF1330 family)